MEGYRAMLHRLVASFEDRVPSIPAMLAREGDMVPSAVRALTMRRYAVSRRDKLYVRLQHIREAHRLLDLIEGKPVGPSFLPGEYSRPGESRRRRAVPGG